MKLVTIDSIIQAEVSTSDEIEESLIYAFHMMAWETCIYYSELDNIPLYNKWRNIVLGIDPLPLNIEEYHPSQISKIIAIYDILKDSKYQFYQSSDCTPYLYQDEILISENPESIDMNGSIRYDSLEKLLELDPVYRVCVDLKTYPLPNSKGQLMRILRGEDILTDARVKTISTIVDRMLLPDADFIDILTGEWIYDGIDLVLRSIMKIKMISWISKIICTGNEANTV